MLLLLLAACDLIVQECNLMDAPSTTTVAFEVASEGTWAWEVTGEGVDMACSVTLPDGTDATCTTGDAWASAEATADGWRIGSTVRRGGAPELHVTLTLDGAEMLDEVVAPEWAVDEPNGEGCGERSQWEETWVVE